MKSVLSIQSHVVHGYVGNKATTFPLQCLGWDVDALNTVQFSNHTGYGSVRGVKTSCNEIDDIYSGLEDINICYDALLTGYIPGGEGVRTVGKICRANKVRNPKAIWLLDPVMGDEGELYVSDDVVPIYQEVILAGGIDLITPNQFEAELITGKKIIDWDSLKEVVGELHVKFGIKNIVISSCDSLGESDKEFISTIGSTFTEGEFRMFRCQVPRIESYFTGTGDLFSAMLLDRYCRYSDLRRAVEETLGVVTEVLTQTFLAAKSNGVEVKGSMGSKETMGYCELRIVECRDIYNKTINYK